MKKVFLPICCSLFLSACIGDNAANENNLISEESFKEFNGVKSNDFSYDIIDSPIMNNNERARLAAVTIYYGIPLRYEAGKITIPESYFGDMNLLYNITIKSNDPIWFNEHISPH